jgi:anti-sigma regulatory factor (Ser/Thr protein kinase)
LAGSIGALLTPAPQQASLLPPVALSPKQLDSAMARNRHHSEPYPRLLASRTLPPEASSAAAARATVRAALPEQLADELRDTVQLLTCELVTNVIVHAATPCRLRLSQPRSGRLRVEVHNDTDAAAAITLTPHRPAGEDGRGLLLVDALAATWGTSTHATGTTVWFEIQS